MTMSALPAHLGAAATSTVVVCTYSMDRLDDLVACLDGIRSLRQSPDEVLVVVDHNAELAQLLAASRLDIRVVANRFTKGLSGARNTAIEEATGDVLVFLDDDAVPDQDWLEGIMAPFANAAVAVVGGHIEPAWPTARPGWFPPHLDWTIGCSIPSLPPAGGPVRNVYGASAAFRRSELAAVGGFPTELGRIGADAAGCEETDVCIRIRQRVPSALVMYAPESNVHHRVTTERATPRYVMRRCYAEGKSKARLAARVGSSDATSDERGYALVILRTAFTDVVTAVAHPIRAARAAVLVGGLGAASFGYLKQSLTMRMARSARA